jgi:hypothetical protein
MRLQSCMAGSRRIQRCLALPAACTDCRHFPHIRLRRASTRHLLNTPSPARACHTVAPKPVCTVAPKPVCTCHTVAPKAMYTHLDRHPEHLSGDELLQLAAQRLAGAVGSIPACHAHTTCSASAPHHHHHTGHATAMCHACHMQRMQAEPAQHR